MLFRSVLFITHSVEEAVGLSDRILVMSPSPGEVIDEILASVQQGGGTGVVVDGPFGRELEAVADFMVARAAAGLLADGVPPAPDSAPLAGPIPCPLRPLRRIPPRRIPSRRRAGRARPAACR